MGHNLPFPLALFTGWLEFGASNVAVLEFDSGREIVTVSAAIFPSLFFRGCMVIIRRILENQALNQILHLQHENGTHLYELFRVPIIRRFTKVRVANGKKNITMV